MDFSQRLDGLLKERGLSAYQISKDTGISDRLIGYWRKGEKAPTLVNLSKLSEYLGVSIDWLTAGEDLSIELEKSKLAKDFPMLWDIADLEQKTSIVLALINQVLIETNNEVPKSWIGAISKGKNVISGEVSGSAFVQGTNQGTVTVHNGSEHTLSEEAAELLRLYESMDIKKRIRLLSTAFEIAEEN